MNECELGWGKGSVESVKFKGWFLLYVDVVSYFQQREAAVSVCSSVTYV